MDNSFAITIQIVLTVLAGISAQVIGEYLKVPSIIFLLLFGIGLGTDGAGLIRPSDLGIGLEVLVSLSVALILFEGGLSLELKELDKVSTSLRNLVTTGVFVTLLGGGMAAHWLGEFPWSLAFLYASLVVVTGPTVINPLLRQVPVDRKVATLLEGEGVLIDPVGAILAVVVLDIILNGDADPLLIITGLTVRLGTGALIGGLGGVLLGIFLKQTLFLSEELRNLLVLASVWGLYGLAQEIQGESGLMAAVVAGIILRALSIPDERLLRRFKGQLTILAVSVLFILLAADLSIASIFALGRGAVLTVAVLMLVVRPLNIAICTAPSDLNWRQKAFLGWIAPRGIVSASVASLFAILLTERGISGGDAIKALVFLTIIITVLAQGLTAGLLARGLGLTGHRDGSGAVIVGCNPLSLLIARLFKESGETVTLIDTNPEACEPAAQENLPVFVNSALDTEVLEEAGIGSAATLLTITNNGDVNVLVAQQAQEEFQLPRIVAVMPKEDLEKDGATANASAKKSKSSSAQKAASGKAIAPKTIALKLWNNHLRTGAVRLGETQLRSDGALMQRAHLRALIRSGELIPLVVKRNNRMWVALTEEDNWKAGDRLIYLLHDPKPKLLQRLSGGSRPNTLNVEILPAVEDVPLPTKVSEAPPPDPAVMGAEAKSTNGAKAAIARANKNVDGETNAGNGGAPPPPPDTSSAEKTPDPSS
ncbi:cation:proton antiporter [Leptolyngbya iicbica]|uniref:Sodium:proton antiporter n=2 Tax=Cyanophyceae TaxID=3028117 RepID=A0A4Q7E5N7_9CYAN|nr:sodium:proton antiporter [Leptolyngbya sp. LK]RZM77389.1 sodium:proton antiporter [Leptolyngbya sp. LK]